MGAVALGFAACSNESDPIFDSSAAERLEQSRNEYFNALSADGGTWAMEYFTNDDEPGYVMVMQFESDGSVTISGNHMWLDGYTSEKSLWDVISDNGTVLTFNTYNNVFHIFSTPENITGPNAPTNNGSDINELGYGHNGDYEFMIMSKTDEGVRLVGKKQGLEAWLRPLPADTDPETYLTTLTDRSKVFNSTFPTMRMVDATGQAYDVTALNTSIPSIVPLNTETTEADPVTQTVSAHGIMTHQGFRFRKPLEVKRADDSTWELTELAWQEDGSLLSPEGAVITGPLPSTSLQRTALTWILDTESLTGELADAFSKACDALVTYGGKNNGFTSLKLSYSSYNNKTTPTWTVTIGKRVCRQYMTYEFGDGTMDISLLATTSQIDKYYNDVPELKAFMDLFLGQLQIQNITKMDASTIVFSGAHGNFNFKVQ